MVAPVVAPVVVVRTADVTDVVVVAVTRCLYVPEAEPVSVREMPAPDRVAIVVILAKVGMPIMTAPVLTAPVAATLALGVRCAGRKREGSIRVERQDNRRRREHEGECRRCGGGALKGLLCRLLRHLGPPFTRAIALVAPVKLDSLDDTPSSKIRQ